MRLYALLSLAALLYAEKVTHTDSAWREILGRERYNVMRKKSTQKAFLGEYTFMEKEGIYVCAGCELPLFRSTDKYNSGSGWPSFKRPIEAKNVYYLEDWSLSFKRYEVLCRRCECHLGHVFNDGPPPKGFRYCINSISLQFIPNIPGVIQESGDDKEAP